VRTGNHPVFLITKPSHTELECESLEVELHCYKCTPSLVWELSHCSHVRVSQVVIQFPHRVVMHFI
jgi:hypothetical protein